MGCGGHGAQARCWLRRRTTWKHGNDGITRQKAFLAAPLHPTLPHYRELPQHPHRGALGCSAHQLICSTLSHQIPAHLPLPAQNYSTSSTELFISLRGCHGARRYGSQGPRKHLFAQSPDGFLENCFPCSAAGNTSHRSATTNWASSWCQSSAVRAPGMERAALSPKDETAGLGLGIFPGHPQHPFSSLIWGFLAPLSTPGCSQASPLGARGCDCDLILFSPPFTRQLRMLFPISRASLSPSLPTQNGHFQAHSSSPIPSGSPLHFSFLPIPPLPPTLGSSRRQQQQQNLSLNIPRLAK